MPRSGHGSAGHFSSSPVRGVRNNGGSGKYFMRKRPSVIAASPLAFDAHWQTDLPSVRLLLSFLPEFAQALGIENMFKLDGAAEIPVALHNLDDLAKS
jgi:hypothetical protein